jgi:hypothetical protein
MARHGGAARVRRLEQGTEVVLTLPPSAPEAATPGSPSQTPAPDPGGAPDTAPAQPEAAEPITEESREHA